MIIERALKKAFTGKSAETAVHDRPSLTRSITAIPVSAPVVPDDFVGITNLVAPASRLADQRIIAGIRDHRVTGAYKMLRTRLLQRMRQNQWGVIAVTSPKAGDGKTVTAINLAISMALESTLSVVALDLDLRRPAMARYLSVAPPHDLSDRLNGTVATRDALFSLNGISRLAFLPNLRVYQNSSELLSSPQMASLMSELRGPEPSRRIVICDVPPVLAADDFLAFSPFVDALLLVVAEGVTPRGDLTRVAQLLENLPVAGVVLNRSEGPIIGYGYDA
jgi:Mrp family chromosome partitioning ATPase